ncbi:uncharacterized protein TRIREDRAFT_120432 [Trichoderma reesei QM6a]|jgi:hypothetical protein|uniref:Predicted protein n=2 Tax=Hypocrea jecorina TaxID=51453 RepID=G0RCA8_HYPJQ|nr:uncharacterized protein TRIREDRAFT_120432 [Trichoderma reesei QM6a]EGR51475.1 predicted protein [Trichoderma reesei QM6a]ETS04515.1 hypothetical protein M419DRAFT_96360 [Trichoderma reesei RUT C-30]
MFSTKSAQSLRNLFASYHEPPSISKQQSQKLLDGLKASFRSHLDREYGRSSSDSAPAPANAGDALEPQSNTARRRSAATLHLKSILANPLFSYDGNKQNTAAAAAAASHLPKALWVPDRDPMDVFDHAVSRGMMTLKAATGCLVAKGQQMGEGHAPVAGSDTALRVVRWLRSSGAESSLQFLDRPAFVQALAPFLVAEKMEGIAWEWITRTMNEPAANISEEQRIARASSLLSQLVRIKSQSHYGNLDAAIQAILEAEQLFQHSPLLPKLLVQPWRSVSWLSTVEAYSRAMPTEKLFEAHMATAQRLPRPFPVETAHLHLHHPTHPDHAPAMRFFNDKKRLRKLVQALGPEKVNLAKFTGMGTIPWIAFLGHDTVNHLQQSGRSEEARGITNILRSELSDIFAETLTPA